MLLLYYFTKNAFTIHCGFSGNKNTSINRNNYSFSRPYSPTY